MSKIAKFWLPKSIFYVKDYLNLPILLGAHFLLWNCFDNFDFYSTLFSKMMSIFWWLLLNWYHDLIFSIGLVIGLEHKWKACKMCESVQKKFGHTNILSRYALWYVCIKSACVCSAIIWTCRDKNREVSVSLNLPIQIIQASSPNFLHKIRVGFIKHKIHFVKCHWIEKTREIPWNCGKLFTLKSFTKKISQIFCKTFANFSGKLKKI